MRVYLVAAMFGMMMTGPVLAADMHMISRKSDGTFHASHRVFQKRGDFLHEITLCGQTYFARAATVAWMNYEAEEGRDVGLEFNRGKGWFRVCERPDQQVKLADLGIKGNNADVMRSSDDAMDRRQRFNRIRKAFSSYTNSGKSTPSYHAR